MSNVVDMDSYRKRTWVTGPMMCTACKHEWVGVCPQERLDAIDCPECGTGRGLLKYPVVPEAVLACGGCEGQLFYITPDGLVCRECGLFVGE